MSIRPKIYSTEPMNTMHYDQPNEQVLRPSGLLGPVSIHASALTEFSLEE